jgi:hypothetical protein
MMEATRFTKNQILPLGLILLIGVGFGWLGFLLFGDMAKNSRILYVSSKEIQKLEQERISKIPAGDKMGEDARMFFGRVDEALAMTIKIAKSYEDKTTKIVFTIDHPIKGEGVISIAKQVHEKIIDDLSGSSPRVRAEENQK